MKCHRRNGGEWIGERTVEGSLREERGLCSLQKDSGMPPESCGTHQYGKHDGYGWRWGNRSVRPPSIRRVLFVLYQFGAYSISRSQLLATFRKWERENRREKHLRLSNTIPWSLLLKLVTDLKCDWEIGSAVPDRTLTIGSITEQFDNYREALSLKTLREKNLVVFDIYI